MQGSPSMEDVNFSKLPFWKDHMETTRRVISEAAQLFSLHIYLNLFTQEKTSQNDSDSNQDLSN